MMPHLLLFPLFFYRKTSFLGRFDICTKHISKICRYIEFYDVMSVPMAIALSGQPLLGQAVMVKPSEAEKNLVQSNATSGGAASGGGRKLYVGNLHSNITEDQLRQVHLI